FLQLPACVKSTAWGMAWVLAHATRTRDPAVTDATLTARAGRNEPVGHGRVLQKLGPHVRGDERRGKSPVTAPASAAQPIRLRVGSSVPDIAERPRRGARLERLAEVECISGRAKALEVRQTPP